MAGSLLAGARCRYLVEGVSTETRVRGSTPRCYYCCQSNSGTPPLEASRRSLLPRALPKPLIRASIAVSLPPSREEAPGTRSSVLVARCRYRGRRLTMASHPDPS